MIAKDHALHGTLERIARFPAQVAICARWQPRQRTTIPRRRAFSPTLTACN